MNDFDRGNKDCRDGVAHQDGMGELYDQGYDHEYQKQCIDDANTENRHGQ